MELQIIKKDGTLQPFNEQKIIDAVNKSAQRDNFIFSESDYQLICNRVFNEIDEENFENDLVPVGFVHNIVEKTLLEHFPTVGYQYQQYRNYKKDFVQMLDDVYSKSQKIMYIGDKENSNTDSALVSTKRSLIFNELNRSLYKKFFLTVEEVQAIRDGYIYIHDMNARRDCMNCFARDTRFITNRGVKSFYDFQEGEEITVLTHMGNWKKATVRSYGYQKIQTVKFKRASGNVKEVKCTPNHRWILKDGTETTNLKVGDKLIAAPNISEIDWDTMTKEEKMLWCIGFGIADGSISEYNSMHTMKIRLCGHKTEFAARFEDCGYNVTYPTSLNGDGYVNLYNIHSKEIPWLILNYKNVKFLVDGWLSADGHIGLYKSNKYRGIQISGEANDYIYDLLNMSGYYVTNCSDLTEQETNYGVRTSKTICYGFHSNQNDRTWVVESIEPAYINGRSEVWCLEVEDDHSFILENGIPTGNCCLFDVKNVLNGGFEMGNLWYNEPKTLDVAFDVIGDIVLSAASQQYGGFTVPQVDEILSPFAEKTYKKYVEKYINRCRMSVEEAEKLALEDIDKEMRQGYQGWEYKFNTVASSRGDYPFITITFGLGTDKFSKMLSKTFLEVHRNGQGKDGNKKPVLFPKLVFLYTEDLHGEGKINEDLFEEGIKTSAKAMYPDWLSLDGDTTIAKMYHKYGKAISPMGKCKLAHVKRPQTNYLLGVA